MDRTTTVTSVLPVPSVRGVREIQCFAFRFRIGSPMCIAPRQVDLLNLSSLVTLSAAPSRTSTCRESQAWEKPWECNPGSYGNSLTGSEPGTERRPRRGRDIIYGKRRKGRYGMVVVRVVRPYRRRAMAERTSVAPLWSAGPVSCCCVLPNRPRRVFARSRRRAKVSRSNVSSRSRRESIVILAHFSRRGTRTGFFFFFFPLSRNARRRFARWCRNG